ncbi:MAG: hypothetical protein ACO1RX_14625 [Candidatus Sericytochromatia bacterium]
MPHNRFLILTRRAETAARNLEALLSPLGRCELIVDQPDAGGIWIPDHHLRGFEGLMGASHFPVLTAWSRALYHAAQTLAEEELVWFVEEDVAGDAAAFRRLVHVTSGVNPDLAALQIYSQRRLPRWHWWTLNPGWFAHPWKSFNPLCALSPALIRQIVAVQAERQRLTFHELLFASVAMQGGLQVLAWDRQPHLATCFGHFCWRPELTQCVPGISHPVKDAALHSRISAL